jgi:Fe-S cluster assembly protein SufD
MNAPDNGSSVNADAIDSFADESLFRAFAEDRSWEPGWMADLRKESWKRYRSYRPPVHKDERWRFSPQARLSLSAFAPPSGPDGETTTVINSSEENLKEKGVTLGLFDKVLLKNPTVLEGLSDLKGPDLGADNVHLLAQSFSGNGIVLHVPKGVILKKPIIVTHLAPPAGRIRFYRTIMILEKGAKATLLETFISPRDRDASVVCSAANIVAKSNAKATRILIQDLNRNSSFYQLDTKRACRDAGIRCCSLHLGSAQSRFENLAIAAEEGAGIDLLGLSVGKGTQLFDQRTKQLHLAPNGRSDLLYKNALLDQSKAVFSGIIKVEEQAQQTDAYQTNRNLLLSPQAEADSLPGLEILANEVKCSHGSTIGEIDQEQLFYLLSRGISKASAEELLVKGFLDEVFERLKNEELADLLREHLKENFSR